MVTLSQDSKGAYRARKRLPDDVREEYGHLYGPSFEAKFHAPASTKLADAKRMFGDWLAQVESQIEAIRAHRTGEGQSLTHRQARALAGEWYDWFTARHPLRDREEWEHIRDTVHVALREAVGEARWEANNPDDVWRDDEAVRQAVRPVLADAGQTSQFLVTKRMVLNNEARDQFLDFLYEDLAQALKLLLRNADGDYGPDTYRERFPKFEGKDSGETPMQLFEQWVVARGPSVFSVESWRPVFRAMAERFKDRSAASITPEEAQEWITSLVTNDRSARTVRKTWITASKTIFRWGVKHKHISRNPFEGVEITVPKRRSLRDTKAFYPHEYRTILRGALGIADTGKPFDAAKRWLPWLCAYTGARSGEIAQLRKRDVIERDGVWAIHITPDAGNVKTNQARTVPLHAHLIEQGFLGFVEHHRGGPLFYRSTVSAEDDDLLTRKKPRPAQVRQRIANWVRELGVTDPELQPNHAWRHTFIRIARREGIPTPVSNAITGHANKSIGDSYGAATLEDMAEQLTKFPRYVLD